jgi:hypothetical protein
MNTLGDNSNGKTDGASGADGSGSMGMSGGSGSGIEGESGAAGGGSGTAGAMEEMVVPADGYFTRCPVSQETFLPEWDTEEGDYLYRNAVKVLVTEAADDGLYSQSQATSHPLIRYAIVHQCLVMDGWLASGKSVSLRDALKKVRDVFSDDAGSDKVAEALLSAAGEDENEDDVFIILEGDTGCVGSAIANEAPVASATATATPATSAADNGSAEEVNDSSAEAKMEED